VILQSFKSLFTDSSHVKSLVFLCLSSHYQFVLLPHYEPVPPQASIGYGFEIDMCQTKII
jgi:hypothetical protein